MKPWDTRDFVDGLEHVDGNTYGSRLVRNGSIDGLSDPPGGVGGELITSTVVEFVHGLHQTDVAFLNSVEKVETSARILLGNGNHETQVGFDEFGFGAFGDSLTAAYFSQNTAELNAIDPGFFFGGLRLGQERSNGVGVFLEFVESETFGAARSRTRCPVSLLIDELDDGFERDPRFALATFELFFRVVDSTLKRV